MNEPSSVPTPTPRSSPLLLSYGFAVCSGPFFSSFLRRHWPLMGQPTHLAWMGLFAAALMGAVLLITRRFWREPRPFTPWSWRRRLIGLWLIGIGCPLADFLSHWFDRHL